MNLNKAESTLRALAIAITMGVVLSWASSVAPMWIEDVKRGSWPQLGPFHQATMFIAGLLGAMCGVLTAPAVIACLTRRPFLRAMIVVYTPPFAMIWALVKLSDLHKGSLVIIVIAVAATLLVSCAVAWFTLPAIKLDQELSL